MAISDCKGRYDHITVNLWANFLFNLPGTPSQLREIKGPVSLTGPLSDVIFRFTTATLSRKAQTDGLDAARRRDAPLK